MGREGSFPYIYISTSLLTHWEGLLQTFLSSFDWAIFLSKSRRDSHHDVGRGTPNSFRRVGVGIVHSPNPISPFIVCLVGIPASADNFILGLEIASREPTPPSYITEAISPRAISSF